MTTPTHLLIYVTISNIMGIELSAKNLIYGGIGALLPDISNPHGGIGRILKPVSAYIGQKWGHRTITHSWVMLTLILALCIFLKWITVDNAVWLIWLGALTHIVTDMINISGVKFFYPDNLVAVMPVNEENRVATGSKKEKRLAFAMLVIAVITLPFGIWGHKTVVRFLVGSHTAAIEEYKSFIDVNEVYVEVKTGINRITQKPINDKTFRVVAAMPRKITLVETEDGKRITLGQVEDAIIETKQMKVRKGVPINSEIIEVNLATEGWNKLIEELQNPFSYAIGTIVIDSPLEKYRPEVGTWEGIDISGNTIKLNYSGLSAVAKLRGARIIDGIVKVRKETSTEGVVSAWTDDMPAHKNTETFLINISHEGLLIYEGQRIKKGDVIASEPEALKIREQINAIRWSKETLDVEEERAKALRDRSLEIQGVIERINKNIEAQKRIVEQTESGGIFKEAESSRLFILQSEKALKEKELHEVKRSIEEEKAYINKKKEALKKEKDAQIKVLKAELEAITRRSPRSGTVKSIKQKNANVFEIEIETEEKKI